MRGLRAWISICSPFAEPRAGRVMLACSIDSYNPVILSRHIRIPRTYRSLMDREYRIGRRLKLRHMEILLAVVETGSMAKAGSRLAISQPAISRAIAEMEHTLGVPVFDRSPHGVEPTQYGRALLKRGLAAFDEVAQ